MKRDGHDHEHDPAHGVHGHGHYRELGRKRLIFVFVLTFALMLVELVGGWLANSLALMADAGHMLSDVGALGLTMFALWFASRPATPAKTYGYLRIEILAALANGVALVVIALAIIWQAFQRFRAPQPVEAGLMLAVATAGITVNLLAAALLHRASGQNLNIRGAYLHVLGDLASSVGVIAAAILILTTGWSLADPIISCVVAVIILIGSSRLLRESVDVLLEAVPGHIDLEALHRAIAEVPGVEAVHDLHVWTLTSGYFAMSGHALIRDPRDHQRVLDEVHERMHDRFGISHVTVQVEHRTVYPIRHTASPDRRADAGPEEPGEHEGGGAASARRAGG